MNEKEQKISLFEKLNNIGYYSDNTEIKEYIFHSAYLVILNYIKFDTKNNIVKIILHLDEFIMELYSDDNKMKSYSIPYDFLDGFYIFLEDDNDDDKKYDNEA